MLESTNAIRAAAAATLRDLRRSILAGRAISLPNVLRLYRRRVSEHAGAAWEIEYQRLVNLYRERQPFRRRG